MNQLLLPRHPVDTDTVERGLVIGAAGTLMSVTGRFGSLRRPVRVCCIVTATLPCSSSVPHPTITTG